MHAALATQSSAKSAAIQPASEVLYTATGGTIDYADDRAHWATALSCVLKVLWAEPLPQLGKRWSMGWPCRGRLTGSRAILRRRPPRPISHAPMAANSADPACDFSASGDRTVKQTAWEALVDGLALSGEIDRKQNKFATQTPQGQFLMLPWPQILWILLAISQHRATAPSSKQRGKRWSMGGLCRRKLTESRTIVRFRPPRPDSLATMAWALR